MDHNPKTFRARPCLGRGISDSVTGAATHAYGSWQAWEIEMKPYLLSTTFGLVLVGAGMAPFALGALPAQGQATMKAEMGLKVGAHIPAFTATSDTGAVSDFNSLKGTNGLTFVFFRSADWCPFCKAQLIDLNTIAADLTARGYPLVALSYDPVPTLAKFKSQKALGYTLLSDPKSTAIDAFGVRNDEVRGQDRYDGIPNPAIFIIGNDGVVMAKLYEDSYRKRPPAQLVLQTVDSLH
jgi:peroxiredoxin